MPRTMRAGVKHATESKAEEICPIQTCLEACLTIFLEELNIYFKHPVELKME